MNIFWYLLILVFFEVSIFLEPAGCLSEGQVARLLICIMREPGYDFVNNTKKWRKVRSSTTLFHGVSLQVIEQTSGCKAMKAVSLS